MDMSDLTGLQSSHRASKSKEVVQAQKLGKVTCLDFLD